MSDPTFDWDAGSFEPFCVSCGQKIRKLNPHVMCRTKVRVLVDLAYLQHGGAEWVRCESGRVMEGSNGERIVGAYRAGAHTTYLKWFGLVDHEGRRTCRYRINDRGIGFLAGRESVPAKILCRDGRVVERTPELVKIGDIRGVVLDKAYWDTYWHRQVHPHDPAPFGR